MASPIIISHKDYLECHHLLCQELVRAHESGAEVGTMTYKDGLYQFSVSMPEPKVSRCACEDQGFCQCRCGFENQALEEEEGEAEDDEAPEPEVAPTASIEWNDGGFEQPEGFPEFGQDPGEEDEDEPDEDPELRAQRQAIQRINASDILRDLSLHIEDEPLSSPLVQAVEVWLSEPQPDWSRLMASPMNCERVGRHILGLLAAIVERHVMAAMSAGRVPCPR
jgi:hypothetical protein